MPNKRPRGPQPYWRPKRETLRVLAAIVRQAIDAHRDPQVHRQALAREQAERRAIRERLNR